MYASVYFVQLTAAQRDELNDRNNGGWGSELGQRYLAAKDGQIDETNFDLLELAATGGFSNAEDVWVRLQNVERSWDDSPANNNAGIKCHTRQPRSMDVGDIVVWSDGRRERCADAGFDLIVPTSKVGEGI